MSATFTHLNLEREKKGRVHFVISGKNKADGYMVTLCPVVIDSSQYTAYLLC